LAKVGARQKPKKSRLVASQAGFEKGKYIVNVDYINKGAVASEISLFKNALAKKPYETMSVETLLWQIGWGSYQKIVEKGRDILKYDGEDEFFKFKKSLPCVTFSGVFEPTRKKENITSPTGLLVADFDHLDDVQHTKTVLSHDPYVRAAFISPSNYGAKALFIAENIKNDTGHKIFFAAVQRYIRETYQLDIDESGKDICRLCFVSYDPDMFVNESPDYFPIDQWQTEPPPHKPQQRPEQNQYQSSDSKRRYVEKCLETLCGNVRNAQQPGSRHDTHLKNSIVIGGYIGGGWLDEQFAISQLQQAIIDSGVSDPQSRMQTIIDGVKHGKTKPLNPPEREYQPGGSESSPGGSAGDGLSEEWEEPLPLNCELLPVEKFNVEWLPEPLRDWVADIAHRQSSPVDYSAIGAMAVFASLVGKKCGIRPKKYDDWIIVPNNFGCIIGRPSAKKSPALSEVLKPLYVLEYEAKERFERDNLEWTRGDILHDMQTDDLKKKAADAVKKGDTQRAKALLADMNPADDTPKPARQRYLVNDTTIEKLGELLAENPNGVLIYRDELSGFFKTINREDKSNDKAFYCESWNGLNKYTYDRIGRGTVDIENCVVSIVGCLTSSQAMHIVSSAMNTGLDDDGMFQRFQFLVYPDHPVFEYVDRFPDKTAREYAYNFFRHISELTYHPGEYDKVFCFKFADDAQQIFIEWLTALEHDLSADDIHPAIESHLGKYRSLIPSLALLIHLGEYSDSPDCDVQIDSLNKAISFGNYLKSHAMRVYGMALNNDAHLGKLLLEKIKMGKLSNPFVISDAKRPKWHGLSAEGTVETAIKTLLSHGYLKHVAVFTSGRKKTEYHISQKI
jgi:hypothetical protein